MFQAMNAAVDVIECDLSSLSSVRCCAEYYVQMKW